MHNTGTQTRTPRKLQPKPMPSYDRLDHERSPKTPTATTGKTHSHSHTKNATIINSNSLRLRVQQQLFKRYAVAPSNQKALGVITVSKRKLMTSETETSSTMPLLTKSCLNLTQTERKQNPEHHIKTQTDPKKQRLNLVDVTRNRLTTISTQPQRYKQSTPACSTTTVQACSRKHSVTRYYYCC